MRDFLSCLSNESLKQFNNAAIDAMERDAIKKGATQHDLEMASITGFHPLDLIALRHFTLEYQLLLVFRCPKAEARGFIGILPPKIMVVKDKTNEAGIVSAKIGGKNMWLVSDYDLMCIYKISTDGQAQSKVFFSWADPSKRGPLSQEATKIAVQLNRKLINKIQHGAQDDWQSVKNRGVKMANDLHIAVLLGEIVILGDGFSTSLFYQRHNMQWPYDNSGQMIINP